jgi:hypothetical protein
LGGAGLERQINFVTQEHRGATLVLEVWWGGHNYIFVDIQLYKHTKQPTWPLGGIVWCHIPMIKLGGGPKILFQNVAPARTYG